MRRCGRELGLALACVVAIPLGIISALRKNSFADYTSSFVALIGVSSPVFFTTIVGVIVFAYWLGWLPAFGAAPGMSAPLARRTLTTRNLRSYACRAGHVGPNGAAENGRGRRVGPLVAALVMPGLRRGCGAPA